MYHRGAETQALTTFAGLKSGESLITFYIQGAALPGLTGSDFASFVAVEFLNHDTQATPVVTGSRYAGSVSTVAGAWMPAATVVLDCPCPFDTAAVFKYRHSMLLSGPDLRSLCQSASAQLSCQQCTRTMTVNAILQQQQQESNPERICLVFHITPARPCATACRPLFDTSFEFVVVMADLEGRHKEPWSLKLHLNRSTGFDYEPVGSAVIPWQTLQGQVQAGSSGHQAGYHQAQVYICLLLPECALLTGHETICQLLSSTCP